MGLTETPGIIQAHDASISIAARSCATASGSTGSIATSTRRRRSKGSRRTPTPALRRWDWMPSPVNARLVQDRQMAMGRFAAQVSKSRFNINYE